MVSIEMEKGSPIPSSDIHDRGSIHSQSILCVWVYDDFAISSM
jgi:hypothetical protein